MAKVVVTGANGFLGSWLVRSLAEQGHQVFSLVRKNSDLSELEGAKTEFLYGDILDYNSLIQSFQNAEAVFHLAGLVAYKKSDRAKMDLVNVQGTANVVKACLEVKVPKLIHVSSVVAVGAGFSPNEVLDENSQYNLKHLDLGYFETKRLAEELVVKAVKENDLQAVIVNPSTIYGAGDAKKGSRKTQVKVAQGKFKFYTSGGVNVVAVEDVVQAIISAWEKGKIGERYILAGENMSIQTLFEVIAQEAGVKPPQRQIPNFLLHLIGIIGDLATAFGLQAPLSRENAWTATLFHWFKNDKAKRDLDFNPRPARVAISNSVRWMKENGRLN
jgi:dihydroflavonol-4-reductase